MEVKVTNPNKLPLIDYRKLVNLQPNSFKDLSNENFNRLKNSFEEHGFFVPVWVWQEPDTGIYYTIDGHQRLRTLSVLCPQGLNIPYVIIDAADKREAAKKLLAIDSKYGKRTIEGEQEFIAEFEIDEAYLDEVVVLEFENVDLGEDFELPSGDKAPFRQITFTLADEQAEHINNALSSIKETDDFKYCETFGNENSNGNALYLIISQWAGQSK